MDKAQYSRNNGVSKTSDYEAGKTITKGVYSIDLMVSIFTRGFETVSVNNYFTHRDRAALDDFLRFFTNSSVPALISG
jgi:hypothetical protein